MKLWSRALIVLLILLMPASGYAKPCGRLLERYGLKPDFSGWVNAVDFKAVEKSFRKLPNEIMSKFQKWTLDIRDKGLTEVRKLPGWNDHALVGSRKGQRSVYLNRSWRVIYDLQGQPGTIRVLEIMNHDY